MKLADTPDLGSGAAMREGSSPFIRTTLNPILPYFERFCLNYAEVFKVPLYHFELFQKGNLLAGNF